MPEAGTTIAFAEAIGWLGAVAVTAFLVSWLLTDVGHVGRPRYIGVLAVVAVMLALGYQTWSESGASFWTQHWLAGVIGALVSGTLLAVLISRRFRDHERRAPGFVAAAWEAGVYGVGEGLLLSVLPVVIVWQWWASEGWSEGAAALLGGALAVLASVLVIVVHHLGYRTFRSARLAQAIVGCGVLSVAYALTGSPIAAVGGHIILHVAILLVGEELPPETEQARQPMGAARGGAAFGHR